MERNNYCLKGKGDGRETQGNNIQTSNLSSRPWWVIVLPDTSCPEQLGFSDLLPPSPAFYSACPQKAQPLDNGRRENFVVFSAAFQINNFGHRADC